jgi:hypothetical protein
MAPRKAEILLDFQNYILEVPVSPKQLYGQACQNDDTTINSWRQIWIDQFKANHEKYGPFSDKSIGHMHGQWKLKPAIVAGSGPSLKVNAHLLKDRGGIPLISCLHNFQYFTDIGVMPDYYVTLDAGPVTVEEVYEGGEKEPEHYWAETEKHTLLAFVGTHPELLRKWRGKVHFFTAPVPDEVYTKTVDAIEPFGVFVSNGGNVLGASMYIAKAFCGANPIIYVGADFAFSYDRKFHAWNSKYDANLGYVIKKTDVYGNKVLTWQSYDNFRAWFEYVALKVPGIWINATEGGCLGSYPDGNIISVKQMELQSVLEMYALYTNTKDQCEHPGVITKKILF